MAIERRRDYGKKAPSRDAHKVYIICEGSVTEPRYFTFFEGLSSNLQVITIPSKDGETDPLKLRDYAKQKFLKNGKPNKLEYQNGDTVWFVIDTDSWEHEGKIDPLRDFCSSQNKSIAKRLSYSAWNVAQSNPCFEIWLYYHIMENPPKDFDVDKETFKAYVDRVLPGGFKSERHPQYLEDAIRNAQNNFYRDSNGKLSLFSTEMYVLGTEILHFVKRDLDKLKNKMLG
ncbi:MAG: RloB domain-containing protein [Bacteroidales bacterium]|nr:RloB domain-containing protein [Bacteroidales bacterium]